MLVCVLPKKEKEMLACVLKLALHTTPYRVYSALHSLPIANKNPWIGGTLANPETVKSIKILSTTMVSPGVVVRDATPIDLFKILVDAVLPDVDVKTLANGKILQVAAVISLPSSLALSFGEKDTLLDLWPWLKWTWKRFCMFGLVCQVRSLLLILLVCLLLMVRLV